ncbi:hypothetical protein J3B02_003020, partial [Coemansia erecta]
MSVKIADTVAKFTHFLSDYPKLIVFFYRQSTAPASKLSLFGELARRIPSCQFACIDLERVKAIENLAYFGPKCGVAVFVNGELKARFADENNRFFGAMDNMDKECLDRLVGFDACHADDELELGRVLTRIINRRSKDVF